MMLIVMRISEWGMRNEDPEQQKAEQQNVRNQKTEKPKTRNEKPENINCSNGSSIQRFETPKFP